MNTNPPRSLVAATRLVAVAMLALWGAFSGGCDDASSSGGSGPEAELFGTAADGGTAEAGAAWQAALEAWPREGNLSILYGSPHIQGQFENWMDGRRPLVVPAEDLLPLLAQVKEFDDSLIALDGAWGPLPASDQVRAMAVRGMRKTLWADLRFAAVEGDSSRATSLLVVMCNLPRVSHVFDGTTRGLLATIGACDAIGWAMRDMKLSGVSLDQDQKARILEASSWLDAPAPFGVVADEAADQRRAGILREFDLKNRPSVLEAREALVD